MTAAPLILMTGAAGQLATMLRPVLAAHGHQVRLSDARRVAPAFPGESFVAARLERAAAMRRACRGAQTLLHLGGVSRDEMWGSLIAANVTGTATCLEEARAAGITRIVFASSLHVLGMHPRHASIDENSPPAPDSRYGVTKLFGEGLCRLFADKYGLSVTVIRIGHAVADLTKAAPGQGISHADLARVVLLALARDTPGFAMLHAVAPHDGYPLSDGRLAANFGFTFADHGPSAQAIFDRMDSEPDAANRHFRGGDFAAH